MKHLFTGIAIASLALAGTAFAHGDEAHDHDHEDDARVIHYEVEPPKTEAEALAMISTKNEAVGEVMAKDALDGNDLEKVHEHTYTIEVAVAKLREDESPTTAEEAALDSVDEANQALHYASENHKEADAREWYGKLAPAAATLDAAYKAEAAAE